MQEVPKPAVAWYRDMFARVGAPWLWASRLKSSDAELATIIHVQTTKIFVLTTQTGQQIGFSELDFSTPGICEIAFFGLLKEWTGAGLGRFMMAHALYIAKTRNVAHIHVHTCTLDDPQALAFYLKSGFQPVRRAVEILDDPRKTGLLALDASTQPFL